MPRTWPFSHPREINGQMTRDSLQALAMAMLRIYRQLQTTRAPLSTTLAPGHD